MNARASAGVRGSLIALQPHADTMNCSQGRAVLSTDGQGMVRGSPRHGLFVAETRVLSRYVYLAEHTPPLAVALSNVAPHSWLGYYAIPAAGKAWRGDTGSGEMEAVSEKTIELRVSRTIGLGMHEDLDFTNYTQAPARLVFEIDLAADFADQAETGHRKQRGRLRIEWQPRRRRLSFDYRAVHRYRRQAERGTARLRRGLEVRIDKADSPPTWRNGRLCFTLNLPALGNWHACVRFTPVIDGARLAPLYGCHSFLNGDNRLERRRRRFLDGSTRFDPVATPNLIPVVDASLRQAKIDLASLRLPDLEHRGDAWVPAAGLPIYIALFGRDTLTAAWQAATVSAAMMRGTLEELPRWQGRTVDDWRDEQPGRMLHEAHSGPLARLNYNPRARYYGAATTASFYAIVLGAFWRWTNQPGLLRRFIPPALRGLAWKDNYTDLFGDGFYAYQTHSEKGNRNQGWKDSGDAIVYSDGSEVRAPISTCEEQAYVYAAKLCMAEVLWAQGERDRARRFYRDAVALKQRFNDRFWMPRRNFYALGLDSHRRQIASIASNPGHLLACGIAEKEQAAAVARRLLAKDLYSGWGVRTLSAKHPAYDPFSYHRGSVWPVEHGAFALGLMRYGLYDELHTLARGMFEAAALFQYHRLPECFSGHPRDKVHPFPALYPKTNWPQAWSASALFAIMQALLGVAPFAPERRLLLDPHLPEWLPEVTVRNLRVGDATCSLRFFRSGTRNRFEVLDLRGKLRIVHAASSWPRLEDNPARLEDALAQRAA